MQSAFLSQVAQYLEIDSTNPQALKDYTFVFPTRRAGLYFKQHLIDRFEAKTFWSPQLLSIQEFTESLADSSIIQDKVRLVLELFECYKAVEPEVEFDKFYPWGQILVKDFDEIDKYLVDAEKLYTVLRDFRSLDEVFELDPDQYQYLKEFWNAAFSKQHDMPKEFIRIWEELAKVYKQFKEKLELKGTSYDGMAQRKIVERFEKEGIENMPFKHIVFVGFNALSTAEKTIIEYLSEHKGFSIYWDADEYYLNESEGLNTQEAGKFLCQYYQLWKDHPKHTWIIHDMRKEVKKLVTVGVPLKVSQSKFVGQLMAAEPKGIDISKKAIVLGDESMLFPCLFSLPDSVQELNITMGYPLKDSPLYQLLESIYNLHARSKGQKDPSEDEEQDTSKVVFATKDVMAVLTNPYIRDYDTRGLERLQQYFSANNVVYSYAAKINESLKSETLHQLFKPVRNASELIEVYQFTLQLLFKRLKAELKNQENLNDPNQKTKEVTSGTPSQYPVALEFIFHSLKQLLSLKETLEDYPEILNESKSLGIFWRLLKEVIASVKLPFTGEPLNGLQLMGFLETRALDFDNLYLLGLNEGAIPSTKLNNTFIPMKLRNVFGLPTYLDQDAIYAYHFFRLLQRCNTAYLFFDTEVGDGMGSEKSRFLLQIEYELKQYLGKNLKLENWLVNAPLPSTESSELMEIEKTESIVTKLEEYHVVKVEDREKPKRKLSPTALSTYVSCPLQFYFRYIAELKEQDEIEDKLSPRIFGSILHRSMELLYEKFGNDIIQKKDLVDLLKDEKQIQQALDQAFIDEKFEHHKSGKNLLFKKVILQLIAGIIKYDQNYCPFKIVGLESSEYEQPISVALPGGKTITVVVSGTIDRVDLVDIDSNNPIFRIVDYKTGKSDLGSQKTMGDPEKAVTQYFTKTESKAGLQAMLYSYMYHKKYPLHQLKAGLYGMQEVNKGVKWLNNGNVLTEEYFSAFESELKTLLTELFDPAQPFVKTENEANYKYSKYKDIVFKQ